MKHIRNLGLAIRLGGAFGALCLSLAIVALTGVLAMHGLRADSDELANRHLRAAELLANLQMRAKDDVSLVAQHLFVHDGDLAAQDRVATDLETNLAKNAADGAALTKLFAGSPVADEYADYTKLPATMAKPEREAIRRSRVETIQDAEERDGSRGLYGKQILALDDQVEKAGSSLIEASHAFAQSGVRNARAAAHSGTRLILLITIVALLAAIALALWV